MKKNNRNHGERELCLGKKIIIDAIEKERAALQNWPVSGGADNKLPYDVAVVSLYRTMNTDSDIAEAFDRVFSAISILLRPLLVSRGYRAHKMFGEKLRSP